MLDNNLSPRLAKALAALSEPHGHAVRHLKEKFAPDAPDADWIKALSDEGGWVIVTHDRFAKNSLEKEALRASGLITFILAKGWANLPEWDKAWTLVRWWPRILSQSELVKAGAFFVPVKLSGKGKFEPVRL